METVMKVSQLSKSYCGSSVICNLQLEVKKGEAFGLLGANGAGKSTFLECILGTKKPDYGKVTILGMNPVLDRKKLFEQVGVQFQESNYPDKITVSEICEQTQSLYQTFTDYPELLNKFGLSDQGKRFVSELSGGQKQRLFIVLTLIPNPQIVFMDELTTGLDLKARRDLWKYLIDLKKQGLTIFLTSHFMDEVEAICDRIGILKNGTLIFCGTVQEAITNSPYDKLEEAYLWYLDEEEEKNESI